MLSSFLSQAALNTVNLFLPSKDDKHYSLSNYHHNLEAICRFTIYSFRLGVFSLFDIISTMFLYANPNIRYRPGILDERYKKI